MFRFLPFSLACGLLLACWHPAAVRAQASSTPGAAPTNQFRDLAYVEKGTQHQKLDLYLPDSDEKAHPLVLWVHGGGWQTGSRFPCPLTRLTAHGYAVASVGYRFSQEAIFPAQIEDCKAAVRWLRAHATEYHLDPARFGAAGESAGGHLVALLGTTGNIHQFDVGTNLDQPSSVQCVIDLFGPADFLHWGDNTDPRLNNSTNGLARLIGGQVDTHQDAARAASPVYYVGKDAAPFLLLHGDKDPLVPLQQSETLDAALKKAGVPSTLRIVSGGKHGGPEFNSPENLRLMADFLNQRLSPSTAPRSP